MSSSKRDHSPSVEVDDPHSAEEKKSEEDEFPEREEVLISGHDEPQTKQKDFRNENETIVRWKFFAVPPKGTYLLKNIILVLASFSCGNCEFLGFNFGHCQANEWQNALCKKLLTARDKK